MSQYQTILKTVEALQWTGENEKELKAFIGKFKDFAVLEDKTIIVRELSGDVDFILLNSYVIKKGKTFATSSKKNFERDYKLKQKDIFFENIPIVIFKGVAIANEGSGEFWSVQVPENYQDFVCGWFSATKFIDVSNILNLDFLNLNTFDEGKAEYTSLNHANNLAQYVKAHFGDEYESQIVIFA